MAKARTNVTLSDTWSCELQVLSQHKTSGAMEAPTKRVFANALGASITVEQLGPTDADNPGFGWGPPIEHDPDDPAPPDWPPPQPGEPEPFWFGVYYGFRVTVSAPSSSPSQPNAALHDIWVWIWDAYGVPDFFPIPDNAPTVPQSLSVRCAVTVSGIYAKGEVLQYDLPDRQLMDFTDLYADYSWFADENAEVTITAALPDGSELSVSGPLAEAGQEVELGDNFALSFGWTVHRYDYSDVVYAAIQDVTWGDEPVDFSLCELYNPGADAPDSSQPAWGRTQTHDNCLRIGQYGTGIGTWSHNYQLGQVMDISWTGKVWAPLLVRFKPATGKFADDVPYPEIVVSGPVIEWYQDEDGNWQYRFVRWSGELEVKEQRRSWLFTHEWQRFIEAAAYAYVS